MFEEKELLRIGRKINDLKIELFGTTEVILHSRAIRKCEGVFQVLFDLKIKKKFYEKLIFFLDQKPDSYVSIAIEKRGEREDRLLIDQYNSILDRGTYFVS